MQVAVADIRKSKGLHKSVVDKQTLTLEGLALASPVEVQLKLTNAGERLLVHGTVQTTVRLDCDRCAESFELPLKIQLDEFFVHTDSEEAAKHDSSSRALDGILTYEDDKIELAELFRQELQTALPMQSYCRTDCRGLCGGCGKNLNSESCSCRNDETDPRWQQLLKLNQAPTGSSEGSVDTRKKNQGKQKRR